MHSTPLPIVDLNQRHQPPAYGVPQRDAIGSIVDGIADDFCQQIRDVRNELDRIEQDYLQSAAHAKGILNGHVGACGKLKDELARIRATVAEIHAEMEK